MKAIPRGELLKFAIKFPISTARVLLLSAPSSALFMEHVRFLFFLIIYFTAGSLARLPPLATASFIFVLKEWNERYSWISCETSQMLKLFSFYPRFSQHLSGEFISINLIGHKNLITVNSVESDFLSRFLNDVPPACVVG